MVNHGTWPNSRERVEVVIPFDYGISSDPHDELLMDDKAIFICASIDMVDSFQTYQLTVYMPDNDHEELLKRLETQEHVSK